MNGLEALKRIRQETCPATYMSDFDKNECCDIIEKDLKELEERREMMRRFNEACVPMILDNETEKKLKALEIIKEKVLEIDDFMKKIETKDYILLTDEEYELLKEVIM